MKIKFDTKNNYIVIPDNELRTDGSIVLEPTRDIYSRWKDWACSEEGIVWGEIVKTHGGNRLPNGSILAAVVIVGNGFKIKLPKGCLKVIVTSEIQSSDNSDLFISDKKVLVERHEKNKKVVSKTEFYSRWGFTIIGLILGIIWICKEPTEMEPYISVVLGIIAFVGNMEMEREVKN